MGWFCPPKLRIFLVALGLCCAAVVPYSYGSGVAFLPSSLVPDATALPGGVEIATERGISPNEHQPLFASITPNEQCVSTTPWYNVRRIELAACSAARQRERDS